MISKCLYLLCRDFCLDSGWHPMGEGIAEENNSSSEKFSVIFFSFFSFGSGLLQGFDSFAPEGFFLGHILPFHSCDRLLYASINDVVLIF